MLNLSLNTFLKGLLTVSILGFSACNKPLNTNVGQQAGSKGINVDDYSNPLYDKGRILYKDHCIQCHSLNGTGGNLGPKLDELAKSMDGTYIREAIIEPNRFIKEGYKANIMPQDFENRLSESEMDSLVFYLTN